MKEVMQELMEKQIHNYVDSLLLSKFGMLMTKFGGSGSSGLNSDEKNKNIVALRVFPTRNCNVSHPSSRERTRARSNSLMPL